MFDLIGDIHGHATKLKALLNKLGYSIESGTYRHPERKVLFIGDYIDRGPEIRETLSIVRGMVESESAIALMGNHEYNALCFHFQDSKGGHLRKHTIKNILQHYETLKQFKDEQEEYEDYLEWFATLPLYYETEQFRAAHACWDNSHIEVLKQSLGNAKLDNDTIYQSVIPGTPLHLAIEVTLKGKELKLPDGMTFKDKEGNLRTEFRIKWWLNTHHETYRSLSVESIKNLPLSKIDNKDSNSSEYYQKDDKAVFFGHYWLIGKPNLIRDNVCCLDFSVAQNGVLVAYRMNEEKKLTPDNFVYV